jgi:hypothetical protein
MRMTQQVFLSCVTRAGLELPLQKNSDNQELRWMKIAILKKRKAGEKELFDGEQHPIMISHF